jgi:hypothetical protein
MIDLVIFFNQGINGKRKQDAWERGEQTVNSYLSVTPGIFGNAVLTVTLSSACPP